MLLLCSIVLACLHEEEPVADGDPVGDAVDGGGVDGHVGAGAEGALAQGPRADGEEAVEQPQAGYQALAGRPTSIGLTKALLITRFFWKKSSYSSIVWNISKTGGAPVSLEVSLGIL